MTKPLPDCGRSGAGAGLGITVEGHRLDGAPPSGSAARVVASMLTTAGLMRSATSAKFTALAGVR